MLHFLSQIEKLLPVFNGYELDHDHMLFAASCLQHVNTVARKTMDMNCYLYIYTLICSEIFKF